MSIEKKTFLYVEIDNIPNSENFHVSLVLTDEDNDSWAATIYNYDENPNRFEYHFYLSDGQSIKEAIGDLLPWADIYLSEAEFTDKALTEQLVNGALRFSQEDFVQGVQELKKNNSFLLLACYLADSSCFKLGLKANILAHNFLVVNDFLEKEPVVKQTKFL